jgi:hypothetical protein
MTQADSVHSTPPLNTSAGTPVERPADSVDSILSGLAIQQRDRETTLQRLAGLRKEASAEIERLIAFLDASDPYASTELEQQVDDEPVDDNELDGPENGEDEESDPAEWSLGSLDGQTDQTGWAAGNRGDFELDPAESGIADFDGLAEQVGSQDWQQGALA